MKQRVYKELGNTKTCNCVKYRKHERKLRSCDKVAAVNCAFRAVAFVRSGGG
jgi:hypothetical protein